LEERELVQRVLRGEAKAAQELVVVYRDYMYKTCANVLGYRDPDSEDMVQEAFMIAFKKLPEFEFRAPLKSWLAQICAYLCYRNIRKRNRMILTLDEDLENLAQKAAQALTERQNSDEERQEKLDFLDICLRKISEDCRRILEMRGKEEQSYAAIGKTLKIPMGTVMSRIARCKEALKVLVSRVAKEDRP
jgi:RNA polymerase sigma-70 factor (ECF subfamily)